MLHCRYISVTAQCCPTGCYITVALPLQRNAAPLAATLAATLPLQCNAALLAVVRRAAASVGAPYHHDTRRSMLKQKSVLPILPTLGSSASSASTRVHGRHMAVTRPSHCRYIAVTSASARAQHYRYATVTLPLHYRCATVALPLRYRRATVALGATGGSRRCRHYQEEPTPCNGNVTVM